jgi:glyoxylase-like metal-dependent hydrolase (beta-lactamase superfamily II)
MSQSLQAAIIPVTPFQQNCSLLWCTETKKAAVVDPGGDLDTIDAAIAEQGVTLEKILITHGHIDHAGSAGAFAERHGVPIEGPHKDDTFWIDQARESGATFGLPEAAPFTPDRWLVDGDTVTVGNLTMQVLHCPGHTPGHVVFYEPTTNVAVVGDVLFQGSIGRTDFPRGNHSDLINAITTKLWPLGDDVTFMPGHGPISTFGAERQSNPFVGDAVLAGKAD